MDGGTTFLAEETHRRILRPGNRLVLHSEDAGWKSLHAAVFEEVPFHATESAIGHPSMIYHMAHPTRVARQVESERRESSLIGPRRICLTPGGAQTVWQHSGHPEILQVYLRELLFKQASEEIYGVEAGTIDVIPRFAINDPLLEQLALAIINALEDGRAEDALYIDTAAHMMAVHLVRRHSTRALPEREVSADGLTKQRLRRLIDYIESHLGGDLTLKAMAEQLELSPFYLARVFKAQVGSSPHQYVLDRRISRAKSLLRDTPLPIAEIALAVGFSSQSHLSNRFRRIVGVSPAVYRRQN